MRTKQAATHILRLLAVLTMLLSFSDVAAASPTAQEAADGGLWSMGIGARTVDSPGSMTHTVGAHFTVTSEDGEFIGECTLPEPEGNVPWWNCRVDVPSDRISLVWEDLDSIPAGYAPVENPIAFDPTTYRTGPHNIGAFFENVPVDGGMDTASGSVESTSTSDASSPSTSSTLPEAASPMPFTIQARSCENTERDCWVEAGAHFTVTTEDGEYLGECTLDASKSPCAVDVPIGSVVVVTEDVSKITAGFAPESNPIRFDTAVGPAARCATDTTCHWGPTFRNGRVIASTTASEATETKDLRIWSNRIDDAGTYIDEVGAHFTVATEDGETLGECTLEDNPGAPASCTVPVPVGIVVVVTQDESTITPGFFPESNPIRFDTGVEPFTRCAPCNWGPRFENRQKTASADGAGTPSGSGTSNSSRTSGTTADEGWFAPVAVWLCDDPTSSVSDCRGGAGIVVNVYLASGELVGSCTTSDPMATPWGQASVCTVKGLPFNADVIAKQDPATIPAGYAPVEETIELHVGSTNPAGFEELVFGFRNVPTNGAAGSSGVAEYTILMTFRGCPEGFDPATGDFYAECTIPLDAPDAAVIVWGGDGQGGMSITQLGRQDDGTYVYTSSQASGVTLSGLAPVLRDAYQVFGSDGGDGSTYTVQPAPGEVRQVTIFYYYAP